MAKTSPFSNQFTENRKARFEYQALESFKGGLVLTGSEAKSVREGGARLDGSYLQIFKGELWLMGCKISRYSRDGREDGHQSDRNKKVLVTKKELRYLAEKTAEKGLTLVPFSLYADGRRIKIAFAIARGKKAHDKRETLKQRDISRSVGRFLRGEDE